MFSRPSQECDWYGIKKIKTGLPKASMELRTLAERILFSQELAVKLDCPSLITDDHPGVSLESPIAPHREVQLQFSEKKGKSEFPALHHLEKDSTRGKILHYFANHELLATELMALVLLKFPKAPKAFRRGVLKTMKDEQEHTRIYIKRLADMGIEFGQYRVNGYFWKMIAPMRTPMDYVSRLSLTFEQANLDFSKYFAGQFGKIGDVASEKLLERIYHDEISHVGYGLKWFRRWKNPELSDWEAYQEQLDFPLSPRRAKAEPFNMAGRERVGLDTEFIQKLYVYSKSKGRTPGIYAFNPFAEQYMAMGPGFTPNKRQACFQKDLEILPAFLCRADDVVLLQKEPRLEHLVALKKSGLELPQFETLERGQIAKASELRSRKIGNFRPWAWSADVWDIFTPLVKKLTVTPPLISSDWEKNIRPLFGKDWSAEQLRLFLEQGGWPDWLCPPETIGSVITKRDQALAQIKELREKGYQRFVIKSIFGSAGGNMMRLWEPNISNQQIAWISNTLEREGQLVVEPWLNRLWDFSVQLEVEANEIRIFDWTHMKVDARGQYKGSLWLPTFSRGLPKNLARFAHEGSPERMNRMFQELVKFLKPTILKTGFNGPMGMDAAIYLDDKGHTKLKPIIEINPRFTMGRLAAELGRHNAPGCSGFLTLLSLPELKGSGFDSFNKWAANLTEHHPIQLDDYHRIKNGKIFLNDPSSANGCLAVWTVSRDIAIENELQKTVGTIDAQGSFMAPKSMQ